MYFSRFVIIRREAEGLIYIGKCQGTKQWPMLPYYTSNNRLFIIFITSIKTKSLAIVNRLFY